MTAALAIAAVVGAALLLGALKSWHLCPVCGSRYGTNLAVARHVKRRHLS